MRRAAIDVGSNSVLLLVADQTEHGWNAVAETSAVTALGEGTKESGVLREDRMVATLAAIKTAFEAARANGAEQIGAAATMAARIASNADEFLTRAQAQGTPVVVLSGDEEADLGFQAVANDPLFHADDRISILDPGGHSTELVTAERVGEEWKILFRRSYPIGTLGLRGTLLRDETPEPGDIMAASIDMDDRIGLTYRPQASGRLVVLGAAGTNLVTIRERMTEWNPAKVHGQYLDLDEIGRACGALMRMTDAQRAAIVGMEKGRERTIHLGALIMERFLNAIGAPGCWVSVRGWRYAYLDKIGA